MFATKAELRMETTPKEWSRLPWKGCEEVESLVMIDLSYLTEEEQQMILMVLKRDAELKKMEEERVRVLERLQDNSRVKLLTGQWFYELRSQRYRGRMEGSEIIKTSLRRRRPAASGEDGLRAASREQEKPSFSHSEKQDALSIPELCQITEISGEDSHLERDHSISLPAPQRERTNPELWSTTKQRSNPFNSTAIGHEVFDEPESVITITMEPLKLSDRDQHDYQIEAPLSLVPSHPSWANEKSKSEAESGAITEEGESILKVLEWFSRSSDSDDNKGKLKELKYPVNVGVSCGAFNSVLHTPVESLAQQQTGNEFGEPGITEDMAMIPAESVDEIKIPISNDGHDSESFGRYEPFHFPLNVESTDQLSHSKSVPESKKSTQKESEGKMANKHDTMESWHDVKPKEVQDEKPPQIVTKMKTFWEKGNGDSKVLINRSGEELRNNGAKDGGLFQTDACRNNSEPDVYLDKKGEEVTLSIVTNIQSETGSDMYKTHTSHAASADFHSKEQPIAVEDPIKQLGMTDSAGTNMAPGPVDSHHGSTCLLDSQSDQDINVAPQSYMNDWMKYTDLPITASLAKYSTPVEETQMPLIEEEPDKINWNASRVGKLKSIWEHETTGPKTDNLSKKDSEIKPTKPLVSSSINKSFDLMTTEKDVSSDHEMEASSAVRQMPSFTIFSMKERMEKQQGKTPVKSQFKNVRDFWVGASSRPPDPQSPSAEEQHISVMWLDSKAAGSQDVLRLSGSLPAMKTEMFINPDFSSQVPSPDSGKSDALQVRGEGRQGDVFSMTVLSPKSEVKDDQQPDLISLLDEEQGVRSCSVLETKPTTSLKMSGGNGQVGKVLKQTSEDKAFESQTSNIIEDKKTHSKPVMWRLQNLNERAYIPQQTPVMYVKETQQQDSPVDVSKYEENQSVRQTFCSGPNHSKPMVLEEIEVLEISEESNLQSPPKCSKLEEIGEQNSTNLPLETTGQVSSFLNSEKNQTSGDEGPRRPAVLGMEENGPSGSVAAETCSQSWSSVGKVESPVIALKRATEKSPPSTVATFTSAEDITLLNAGEEGKKDVEGREPIAVYDVSPELFVTTTSFAEPDKMKNLSLSMPNFLDNESPESGSDSTSMMSLHSSVQRMGSSLTNLSVSSNLASASSVSGSVLSIYSGDFGAVEVKGIIQFSISYVQKSKEFHIFVAQCKDLAVADPKKNRSDPYVKSYLLPNKVKMGKRKTSVKRKTLNPTFNELLRYRATLATIKTQILNLSVWHNTTFGRNSFLGEVEVDLSTWDFQNIQINEFALKPRTTSILQPTDYRGEMRLAIRFMPEISHTFHSGEVHIWIKDCKNLPAVRGSAVDPFVKCFIFPDTRRKSRQKTRVLKRTTNPVFNHTMVYNGFWESNLQEACVELTVWDHDRLSNHFLGGLRLSLGTGRCYGAIVDWMDSSADESMLWKRMMESPNEWVEETLPLRMVTTTQHTWKK